MSDGIVAVDLFCGAGGFSTGLALACEELGHAPGDDVELHAVNHDAIAIESHERNHVWAEHYHAGIEELNPPGIVEPGSVDLMVAGPECTHFSSARGGEPVTEQKRVPAFHVLDWVFKLRPEHVLLENVKEFRSWGSIDDEGKPTRDGAVFETWLDVMSSLGYAVDHRILKAADYGDPTSRRRLFVVASRTAQPSYPEPTHTEDPGPDDDREPWRTASEVIDWSDPGTSLWTRDLENPRVQPLSQTTMERIAEGIRRHCHDRFEPMADAIAEIDGDRLEDLREHVVPVEYADLVAGAVNQPFLVRCGDSERIGLTAPYLLGQHSNSVARRVTDRPTPTVATGGKIQVCNPVSFVLRQHSGGVPAAVGEDPLPTIAQSGAIGLATTVGRTLVKPRNGSQRGKHSNPLYPPEERPLHTVTASNHDGHVLTPTASYLVPGYSERPGQAPRTRSLNRPLMTVPATRSPAALCSAWIDDFEGPPDSLTDPLGTVTQVDRFALVVPEAWPWGLDVRYRMLKPSELMLAQGFPEDYDLAGGTKKAVTKQIGNAVPVNLAKALCKHLLADADPSLSTFGGGLSADPDAEVPDYDEVVSDD